MTKKPPFNLIILGDPAAGKGTQADKLARRYRMYDLDMGREVKKPAALAQYDYAHTTAIGKLTPTVVVRKIFKDAVVSVPATQGIVFNGTPKMVNEAHLVARLLAENKRTDPLVIYIRIPMRETIRRAEKRREYVNGQLTKRDDDSRRALMNRRRYYKEQIARVVEFFRERYEFRNISGMGSEAEVAARIGAVVKRYKDKHDRSH
ncbi:MAG: nucleoside monophosphate kinase [Candidatus Pacebacteria bacterium]|nr:nucleoside monophosphate kinase [Candidatus Paceibacterota bacterium]